MQCPALITQDHSNRIRQYANYYTKKQCVHHDDNKPVMHKLNSNVFNMIITEELYTYYTAMCST